MGRARSAIIEQPAESAYTSTVGPCAGPAGRERARGWHARQAVQGPEVEPRPRLPGARRMPLCPVASQQTDRNRAPTHLGCNVDGSAGADVHVLPRPTEHGNAKIDCLRTDTGGWRGGSAE